MTPVTSGAPPAAMTDGPAFRLPGRTPRRSGPAVARALFALTKPRIIELLLVTTVPAMMLAARGLPRPGLMAVTLAGGALAAGSANTLNCYLDRDIDALMRRTARRPLARPAALAVIRPAEALAFGIGLGAAAVTLALSPYAGWLYTACAAVLGGWFLAGARQVRRGGAAPMRLFHRSITYLTLLFALVAITALLPFGRW